MARKLKLERDKMGIDIINRKVGEIKEDTEKTENLGEQYIRDNETLDRMLESIEKSTLPEEVKRQQRQTLQNSKRILLNNYKAKVQAEMDAINKESQDLIEKVEDTAKETQEHITEMQDANLETGTVSLDANIQAQKEYYDLLEKTKTQEAEELRLRQEQANIMLQHMLHGKRK